MSIKDVSTVDIDFAAKNNEKFLLPIEDHYFERKALSVDMNSLENRNKKSALLQEKLAGKEIPFGGVALFSKFIEQTENNKMSLNKKVVLEIFESEKEDKSEKERVEKRIKEKIIKNGIDGSVEIDWFVREGDFLPKARIEKEIFNLKKEYIGNPYLMNLLLLTLAKNHLETEKHLPNIDGDGKGFFIDTKSEELKLLSKTRKNFITMVKEIKAKILRENNMVDIIKGTRKDLDLQEFKDALKKFADIQKDVPTMLTLDENIPVMEVGDIHNNQAALEHAIMEFLKKKQKGEKVYLLFSGDYSDRGNQGPYEEESAPDAKVWYMLMKLKILYQNDVFLLRGNHEDARLAHQFEAFERMKDYFESKGHEGEELRNLTKDVKECFFESLSVAAKHGNTLIMHGGLPAKNIHHLNKMFTELTNSTNKNLPFEKDFNDKYVYEEKKYKLKEEKLVEAIKRELGKKENKQDTKNAREDLLNTIKEKEKLLEGKNKSEKEKILQEIISLTNEFYEKHLNKCYTYSKDGNDIYYMTIRVFSNGEEYIGNQLLWNEFNEKDKDHNLNRDRGFGFYYNKEDIKKLNEECGYERVINGHNHNIDNGLCVTEVKEGENKCQQIVTMGSPNMCYNGNPGHILIIDKDGKTKNTNIKYDDYWKNEKFKKEGFVIVKKDKEGKRKECCGEDFKEGYFTNIFEGYKEDDAELPKIKEKENEENENNIANIKDNDEDITNYFYEDN